MLEKAMSFLFCGLIFRKQKNNRLRKNGHETAGRKRREQRSSNVLCKIYKN